MSNLGNLERSLASIARLSDVAGEGRLSLDRRHWIKLSLLGGAAALSGWGLSACQPAVAPPTDELRLQVFAANSLAKAIVDATDEFTRQYPNITFFDSQCLGSGQLNSQLMAGSYADVLISAATNKMDAAQMQGSILEETRFDLFSNSLVVVRQKGSDIKIDSLDELVGSSYRIAVGDESVPAGNYARKAFYQIGAYTNATGFGGFFKGVSPFQDANVGNVCQHVQSGEVDLGIVYSSDVHRYSGVEVVLTIPKSLTGDIVYPAAVCSASTNVDAARAFLQWCATNADAEKIWNTWGFELCS